MEWTWVQMEGGLADSDTKRLRTALWKWVSRLTSFRVEEAVQSRDRLTMGPERRRERESSCSSNSHLFQIKYLFLNQNGSLSHSLKSLLYTNVQCGDCGASKCSYYCGIISYESMVGNRTILCFCKRLTPLLLHCLFAVCILCRTKMLIFAWCCCSLICIVCDLVRSKIR